ncbi:SRPBCC domain-containing protein [Mucilaginibacter sp. UR6-11]|uniref:SRPBCC family protein n=1 Tax=Mucilaginibacter sp. UR6-11 TaxID=1435644 RepID=UPI001E492C0D|nr:SRPBCC domain-containing protein [Mucilaginibacter sp. UR6-11]MCC8424636.1 SRPBCC domain-containing protein [Mucilaginibacter sp. UR6-11]
MTNKTEILKDLANKKLNVIRAFNAPVEKVWKAWTDASILDKWWAPRPWRAETKTMDFREGGLWLYCMAGPNGEKAWCRVNFTSITPGQSFAAISNFCDEDGNIDSNFPAMHWLNIFKATATGTILEATLSFDSETDLQKIVEMGFEGGFTMALGNLDELLEA